ncbi:MAG TPA: hypothetical protein VE360_12300, partial [Pyrinomonadaceae bacterium]|nr:hypothetical protein [Pyrinomonadaceae bacterium]
SSPDRFFVRLPCARLFTLTAHFVRERAFSRGTAEFSSKASLLISKVFGIKVVDKRGGGEQPVRALKPANQQTLRGSVRWK